MVESSVSVSVADGAAAKLSAPVAGAPGWNRSVASDDAGSGHSAYGVGFAVPQTRLTVAPSATFWPAAVATADASTRCVASGIAVMTRVVVVIVPDAFVCGTVSVNPSGKALVSATVSVAVFD